MTFPRIKTITIDSHDDAIPLIVSRFVVIDGTPYHLAKDICTYSTLTADEDGDYRGALTGLKVPFIDSMVHDRGNTFGPVALIADDARAIIATKASTNVTA
ncbi:MAG: hypothetical protein DI528_17980 [Shinella sp.]|nr:MAG: hypothetical protein DI528_17980 [Shinella sp.]